MRLSYENCPWSLFATVGQLWQNRTPLQVLFLLPVPHGRPSWAPFWCRRHSQMPLSWPKPLRWVGPKWISRAPPYSSLLGCCPGTTQGFSSRVGSAQKLPPTLPSYQAQLHLRDPHQSLLQNPCLGATTLIPPPPSHQSSPASSLWEPDLSEKIISLLLHHLGPQFPPSVK